MLAALLVVSAGGPAVASPPMEQLRSVIDRVVKILEDPALKDNGRLRERRTIVRQMANEIFDFSETAKRALARHWQSLTEGEREEFVGLFSEFLAHSYLSRIERYEGTKTIQYLGERLAGDVATVSTRILLQNGQEISVDYRMLQREERWFVFDLLIEGVSLVSNYRGQFNKIIQTSSFRELLRQLRARQKELAKDGAAS